MHKTTYIVLKLGKHGGQECGEETVSTRRGNNYCELFVRKEVKKGGCCCVIDSRVELPHCAASVDFPLLRVYSRSVAGMNGEFHSEYTETEPILQTASLDDALAHCAITRNAKTY